MKMSITAIHVIAISALLGMGLFSSCSGSSDHDKGHQSGEQMDQESGDAHHYDAHEVYACPMHPEVTGREGDKCSKCGMDLTEMDHDQ